MHLAITFTVNIAIIALDQIMGQASFALTSLDKLSLVGECQSQSILILRHVAGLFPDLETV